MCQLGQRTAIRQVMGHIGTIKIGAKGKNIFPTQIEKMLGMPQDILHAGDEGGVLFGWDHPALAQMWLQFVFFRSRNTDSCEMLSMI